MFGNKKKIKELIGKVVNLESRIQTIVEAHGMGQRVLSDKFENTIVKKVSEAENKIKQDIDLINFKLENPKPHQLGEVKSGEYKGWIVIDSKVKEYRSIISGMLINYYWETTIVNKKGETKTI